MPLTGKLSLGLSGKLGEETATDLITWVNEMDATHRTEFLELKESIARLENRLVEFKAELKQDIAGVQSELIKWTFLFWLGTIGIVMMLLRYFAEGS
jgi:hypothetical protein